MKKNVNYHYYVEGENEKSLLDVLKSANSGSSEHGFR